MKKYKFSTDSLFEPCFIEETSSPLAPVIKKSRSHENRLAFEAFPLKDGSEDGQGDGTAMQNHNSTM